MKIPEILISSHENMRIFRHENMRISGIFISSHENMKIYHGIISVSDVVFEMG